MIYSSALSAVVSALAAECIDNTSKQKWQQLYQSGELRPCGRAVSPEERMTADCWVFARLHSQLKPRYWHALVAKYSTHRARKVEAIGKLVPLIASHAPQLFVYKAVTAWAVPPMKGTEGKRSTSGLIVLPAEFYDVNTWDLEARTERTRQRWRKAINEVLEEMVGEALVEAEKILASEGVLRAEAA
ncbi:hypothetical protein KRX52_04385 [Pseudomonas sp. MAP12]|uniref:Phage-like protein n=1 Tax=Geopseudomonas aromaticivorans TaxID=2849492 RepID=A0ABS6MUD9_9GAMM|nr:hypothetical protein [Pseudomonas aromaticivorans]MBV2132034.1 hypothetical protein [Pseudomonas aromaticivorans]